MRTIELTFSPQAASLYPSNFWYILCLICSLIFLMFAQRLCESSTEDNKGEEQQTQDHNIKKRTWIGLHPATLGKCQQHVHNCPEFCQTAPHFLSKEVKPSNKTDYSIMPCHKHKKILKSAGKAEWRGWNNSFLNCEDKFDAGLTTWESCMSYLL